MFVLSQVVTAHAVRVAVTNNLSANITGFLPIHCIYQLLRSRAFTKHKVSIKVNLMISSYCSDCAVSLLFCFCIICYLFCTFVLYSIVFSCILFLLCLCLFFVLSLLFYSVKIILFQWGGGPLGGQGGSRMK